MLIEEKEKLCGIYCIENIVNGKKYIGRSNNLNKRLKQHLFYLKNKNYKKENRYLINSFHKHGENNFKFYIVEKCLEENLSEREVFYIKEWNTKVPNGYNLTDGGEGTSGYKFTDEQKKNLSIAATGVIHESRRGVPLSEDHKKKLSESHKGKPGSRLGTKTSEKSKKKFHETRFGVPIHTEESKKRISESSKKRITTNEAKQNMSNAKSFRKIKNASSQYIGVYLRKDSNKWRAYIRYNGERINIGTFDTEINAALAYNNKAIELYGDKAKLNIIENKGDLK